MKSKSLLLFCLTVIGSSLFSCSEIEQDMLIVENNAKSEAEFVSDGNVLTTLEAADIANQAYSSFFPVQSRSASVHLMADASDVSIMNGNSSRSDSGDTLIYIVNFPKDGGYALVAAPRSCQERVLAVVPEGNLDADGSTDNPGLKMFLKDALTYASTYAIDPGIGVTPQPMPEWYVKVDTLANSKIGQHKGLAWGQSSIYGKYCDNNACGCFATAAAMAMAYFKGPQSMDIAFKNNIKESVTKKINIDWNDILKHKSNSSSSASYNALENISLICRQFGELSNADYSKPRSTPIGLKEGRNSLKNLLKNKTISNYAQFNPKKHEYKVDEIKSSLGNNGLAFMCGVNYNAEDTTAHIWLVEEYKYVQIRYQTYERQNSTFPWKLKEESFVSHDYFYHNWGWDGSGNGYFSTLSGAVGVNNKKYTDLVYMTIK